MTINRPYISFAVQCPSQFLLAPNAFHVEVACRVVRYVKQAPGLGLLFSTPTSRRSHVFCDADLTSCSNSRRSITSYLVRYGDSLIYILENQEIVHYFWSSTEAEYRSLASIVAEVVWIIGLLKELPIDLPLPMPMYCDRK